MNLPLVEELTDALEPVDLFCRLAQLPYCVFFDSAMRMPTLGRYSYVAADPFERLTTAADGSDALAQLQDRLQQFQAAADPQLPPFQGGAAGLLGYDLARSLEALPNGQLDEFQIPALAVGLYDLVFAFDHHTGRAWIVSQGFPEVDPQAREERAAARLAQARDWLELPYAEASRPEADEQASLHVPLHGQSRIGKLPGLTSSFTADEYLAAIRRAVEYIHAGDVFQVNLAQRLVYPEHGDAISLYLRLRERNPAPFSGYFHTEAFQICSASPERFLRVQNGHVETRPIKGTRSRGGRAEADLFAGDDLRASEKDRAENVMIVDLLRNDLSKVCRPESIFVPQLLELETYAYVQHLVSVVEGRLAEGQTAIHLLRGAFPGGSITGAPKVRAMEIIAELEPHRRGAYCGSLAYIGFDGAMDSSILIRTITAANGHWQFPVGGGIVAQSEPEREYEETWHKAEGLLRALEP